MATTKTIKLAVTPKLVLTQPIKGGKNAPPETAIIIKPEISFDRSGIFSSAIEKINGNRLAEPSPTMKIAIWTNNTDGEINIPSRLTKATTAVKSKNRRAEIQFRITAPEKRPIIKAVK